MKVMSKSTKLSNDKVFTKAKAFFNNNLGLKLVDEEADCCLDFQSNLGFVTVQVYSEGQNREVKITTREYEYQIQKFLEKL